MNRPDYRRLFALLGALLCLGASFSEYRAIRTERRELLSSFDGFQMAGRRERIPDSIRREPDRERGRNRLARALLADELDPSWRQNLEPQARQRSLEVGLEKLRVAERLSRETLTERPAFWQAAMIMGASRHLINRRTGTPIGARGGKDWRAPLEWSVRLVNVEPEPPRLLAAALLGSWPVLDSEGREEATRAVRRALLHPRSQALLLPKWLSVAPSFETALSVMPPEPGAWRRLQAHYIKRRDHERACRVDTAAADVLLRYLHDRLDGAEKRLRYDQERGVLELVTAGKQLPAEARFAPLTERLLDLLPAAALTRGLPYLVGNWLEWTIDLCLTNNCPLSATGLDRLALAASRNEPEIRALGAVALGRFQQAERLEAQFRESRNVDLSTYFLFKASRFLSDGRVGEAIEALSEAPVTRRSQAVVSGLIDRIATREDLGLADRMALDALTQRTPTEPSPLSRSAWWIAGGSEKPTVRINSVSGGSAAVKILVDGARTDCKAVRAGSRIVLASSLSQGMHSIELRSLSRSAPTAQLILSEPGSS